MCKLIQFNNWIKCLGSLCRKAVNGYMVTLVCINQVHDTPRSTVDSIPMIYFLYHRNQTEQNNPKLNLNPWTLKPMLSSQSQLYTSTRLVTTYSPSALLWMWLQIFQRSLQQLGVGLFISGAVRHEVRGSRCQGKTFDLFPADSSSLFNKM